MGKGADADKVERLKALAGALTDQTLILLECLANDSETMRHCSRFAPNRETARKLVSIAAGNDALVAQIRAALASVRTARHG